MSVIEKRGFTGAGGVVQLIGIVGGLAWFPWSVPGGLVLFWLGRVLSRRWVCSTCGNDVAREAQVCATCALIAAHPPAVAAVLPPEYQVAIAREERRERWSLSGALAAILLCVTGAILIVVTMAQPNPPAPARQSEPSGARREREAREAEEESAARREVEAYRAAWHATNGGGR